MLWSSQLMSDRVWKLNPGIPDSLQAVLSRSCVLQDYKFIYQKIKSYNGELIKILISSNPWNCHELEFGNSLHSKRFFGNFASCLLLNLCSTQVIFSSKKCCLILRPLLFVAPTPSSMYSSLHFSTYNIIFGLILFFPI